MWFYNYLAKTCYKATYICIWFVHILRWQDSPGGRGLWNISTQNILYRIHPSMEVTSHCATVIRVKFSGKVVGGVYIDYQIFICAIKHCLMRYCNITNHCSSLTYHWVLSVKQKYWYTCLRYDGGGGIEVSVSRFLCLAFKLAWVLLLLAFFLSLQKNRLKGNNAHSKLQ